MAVKMYRFGDVLIKVFEKDEELIKNKVEGCRSLCPNKMGKPVGIEIVCRECEPIVGEWLFCHVINQIPHYRVVLGEVV